MAAKINFEKKNCTPYFKFYSPNGRLPEYGEFKPMVVFHTILPAILFHLHTLSLSVCFSIFFEHGSCCSRLNSHQATPYKSEHVHFRTASGMKRLWRSYTDNGTFISLLDMAYPQGKAIINSSSVPGVVLCMRACSRHCCWRTAMFATYKPTDWSWYIK